VWWGDDCARRVLLPLAGLLGARQTSLPPALSVATSTLPPRRAANCPKLPYSVAFSPIEMD